MKGSLPVAAVLLILAGVSMSPVGADQVEATAPAKEKGQGAKLEGAADRLGLSLSKDAPMTIEADELEMVRSEEGGERVVFRNNVELVQGNLNLSCGHLEASYPEGASGRPQRISARESVRITQDDAEVRCSEAVFEDAACKATCRGDKAVLRRGENVIRGDEIEFNLCTGHLKVRGRARVRVTPGEKMDDKGS